VRTARQRWLSPESQSRSPTRWPDAQSSARRVNCIEQLVFRAALIGHDARIRVDDQPWEAGAVVSGPARQSFAVRVAALDEVREIRLHQARDLVIVLGPREHLVRVEVAQGVLDLG